MADTPKADAPTAQSANGVHKGGAQDRWPDEVIEEVYKAYELMGPSRSIPKVRKLFIDNGRQLPSEITIKKWSSKGEWQFRVKEFDRDTARTMDEIRKNELAKEGAEQLGNMASKMRAVGLKGLRRLEKSIETVKIKTGNEFKAMADACVALNKAAEVLDGGVSDRTETVKTVEERQSAAQQIVKNAFANFKSKGNDNAKRNADVDGGRQVGDAGNARAG